VPGVGGATNGRIDFYDQETLNGKAVWVRFSIWSIGPENAASEQAAPRGFPRSKRYFPNNAV
jgi:hypothetical protein